MSQLADDVRRRQSSGGVFDCSLHWRPYMEGPGIDSNSSRVVSKCTG
jgi:hypothetical protein